LSRPKRQYCLRSSRKHYGCAGNSQNRRAGHILHPQRAGKPAVNRRSFLRGIGALAAASQMPLETLLASPATPGFRFVEVTSSAGIQFRLNSGAYGGKLLPETLGSGCAFFDYDSDGWQDILLVNGADWP